MSTAYEPNIQGAIAVLRDLMIANSFTMTREPYEPNYRGLVDAVIDLKRLPTLLHYKSDLMPLHLKMLVKEMLYI